MNEQYKIHLSGRPGRRRAFATDVCKQHVSLLYDLLSVQRCRTAHDLNVARWFNARYVVKPRGLEFCRPFSCYRTYDSGGRQTFDTVSRTKRTRIVCYTYRRSIRSDRILNYQFYTNQQEWVDILTSTRYDGRDPAQCCFLVDRV
jgi:hypothetical protein